MVDISSSLLFNEGHLTRKQKELIATYISYLNVCSYCLDSHGFSLIFHGATKKTLQYVMVGNLDAAAISEAERQLLSYLKTINSESFRATAENVQLLRGLDWTEEQIAEAVHVAAIMGLCNRVANAFGLPSRGAPHLIR